ncbi:unnamed protein product [Arctogadus glacialis]
MRQAHMLLKHNGDQHGSHHYYQYLQQVYEALDNHEGSFCAELLSFKHPHVANPRLQLPNPEDKCQQVLEPPYDEMVAAHLRCTSAAANHDFIEAYKFQTLVVQYPPTT